MHVEGAVRCQRQQGRRNQRAVVEREQQVGPRRLDRGGQRRIVRIVAIHQRQAELRGGVGHAAEPDRFIGTVAMRDHQRHLHAARVQHAQAAVADVMVGEHYGAHGGFRS